MTNSLIKNMVILSSKNSGSKNSDNTDLKQRIIKLQICKENTMTSSAAFTLANGTSTTVTAHPTINCISQCTYSGDANMSTQVVFTYSGNYIWVTQLNASTMQQTLSAGSSVGNVTMKEGCTVELKPMGELFVITLNGTIVDSGTDNKLTNLQIASFNS